MWSSSLNKVLAFMEWLAVIEVDQRSSVVIGDERRLLVVTDDFLQGLSTIIDGDKKVVA